MEILLVEDDPADVRLVREALKCSSITIQLRVARDGDQSLAILRREDGEIIRALVKRVEIEPDQVRVVFRVSPAPTPAPTGADPPSLQHRVGRELEAYLQPL